jgi:hypothetical protein
LRHGPPICRYRDDQHDQVGPPAEGRIGSCRRVARLGSAQGRATARPGGDVSVALYIAQDEWVGWLNDGGPRAYLVGSAVGVIAWLLLAVAARGIATPAGGNPSAYGQLCEMLAELDATHRSLAGEAANASGRTTLAVADEHLRHMRACLEGDGCPGRRGRSGAATSACGGVPTASRKSG